MKEQNDKTTAPSLDVVTAPGTASQAATYLNNILSPRETVLDEMGGSPKLYAQILRDDQVKSTLQQRFSALTSKEWEIAPGGEDKIDIEAAEFLNDQLDNIGWNGKVGKMIYGIFYGYAVAEIMWEINDENKLVFKDIAVRKRHRFKFDLQGNLKLITADNPAGKMLPDRKMWIYTTGADNDDQPYGMGLAHWLYWPCLFKREGIKFWMMFLDKFGSPTPVGKYPANATDAEKEKLLAATQAFQQESGIIMPEGMLIELIEAKRGGRVDYATLYKIMDAAISKVVLSQTMTTDDGASLSQAEVHGGVKDNVIEADAEEICNSFNRGPAKWITEFNFPGAKLPTVKYITGDNEDLNIVADRDNKLNELGFAPTEKYIHETYGDGYQKKERAPDDEKAIASFKELIQETDEVDQHVEDNIDDMQAAVGTDLIEVIMEVAARSQDYDDFVENILAIQPDMTELTDLLARSNFNARLSGVVEE